MPPVMITRVTPTAITAFTEVCEPRLNRLSAVRKDGALIDSTMNTTISAPAAATCETAPENRSPSPPSKLLSSVDGALVCSVMIAPVFEVAGSGCQRDDAFLGELGAVDLPGDPPTAHDQDPIAHVQQLRQVA